MAAHIQFGPNSPRFAVAAGTSLLAAANRAGMPLGQSCRGQGVCNACRVRVDAGAGLLEPLTELERRWRVPAGWRLACQARVRPRSPDTGDELPDGAIVALGCAAWGG